MFTVVVPDSATVRIRMPAPVEVLDSEACVAVQLDPEAGQKVFSAAVKR
jgi:hypothetical protein